MWDIWKRTPMHYQVSKEQETKTEGQSKRLKLDKRHKQSASRVTTGTPLLSVIYDNDLNEGIVGKISKFADKTKFCAKENTEEDVKALGGRFRNKSYTNG